MEKIKCNIFFCNMWFFSERLTFFYGFTDFYATMDYDII